MLIPLLISSVQAALPKANIFTRQKQGMTVGQQDSEQIFELIIGPDVTRDTSSKMTPYPAISPDASSF